MSLGLLLIPALAGYLFLSRCNLTRYRMEQVTGYRIVLQATAIGIPLLIAAGLLASLITSLAPSASQVVGTAWRDMMPTEYSGYAVLSVAIGWLLPFPLNRLSIWNPNEMRRRAAELGGDLMPLVIDQAINEQALIEVSLKTGKSYIGRPLHNTFGVRDTSDIAILPIWSGYRDKDTRELTITVYYASVLSEIADNNESADLGDFLIVFPLREAISVRIFSPEAYAKFQPGQSLP